MQTVYIYKPNEAFTNSWIYYRITSVDSDVPGGTLGAPIQICRVSWPAFEDVLPVIDTPGITGYASAWEQQLRLLLKQWNIEHEQSVMIGILPEPG